MGKSAIVLQKARDNMKSLLPPPPTSPIGAADGNFVEIGAWKHIETCKCVLLMASCAGSTGGLYDDASLMHSRLETRWIKRQSVSGAPNLPERHNSGQRRARGSKHPNANYI